MAMKPIPDGYHTVTPYLLVRGVPEFLEFLKNAFGAIELVRTKGGAGGIHAEVKIGDSHIMMGDDGKRPTQPVTLYLYVPDADAAYNRALKAGAGSIQPPTDQPYGDRSAGVTDPFGNTWYVATHIRDVPQT